MVETRWSRRSPTPAAMSEGHRRPGVAVVCPQRVPGPVEHGAQGAGLQQALRLLWPHHPVVAFAPQRSPALRSWSQASAPGSFPMSCYQPHLQKPPYSDAILLLERRHPQPTGCALTPCPLCTSSGCNDKVLATEIYFLGPGGWDQCVQQLVPSVASLLGLWSCLLPAFSRGRPSGPVCVLCS